MARYEHLPIYKSIYDLNLYFFKLSRGFPKDFKYGLAAEIKALLTELLDKIIIANNSQDKTAVLKEGEILVERIKFKNRLLHDLGVTNNRGYEFFIRQLVDISKQIEKWGLWAEKGRRESRFLLSQ